MALRVGHLADTHLGYKSGRTQAGATGRNQRALDVERAFESAIDFLLRAEVDLILHAGDVFHTPRPSWNAIGCFIRAMRRVEQAGVPCVVIAGNHDTPRVRDQGSVFEVLRTALPLIHFVDGWNAERIVVSRPTGAAIDIWAVPSGALTNPAPVVYKASERYGGAYRLAVLHGLVGNIEGGRSPEPGEEQIPDHLLRDDFDYIALGDWHGVQQVWRNAFYAGATERFSWGEHAQKPGVLVVELEPGKAPNPAHFETWARPMRDLGEINCAGLAEAEAMRLVAEAARSAEDQQAMARITLIDAPKGERGVWRDQARKTLAPYFWSVEANVRAKDEPERDMAKAFASFEITLPRVEDLFAEWVETRKAAWSAEFAQAFVPKAKAALEAAAQRQMQDEMIDA